MIIQKVGLMYQKHKVTIDSSKIVFQKTAPVKTSKGYVSKLLQECSSIVRGLKIYGETVDNTFSKFVKA